ncbi:gliding motility-associated C-terminal domain-containing protein [Flavivirga abyssicola]|uniref:HYR-like domain-containing protein n=1 Tax=Flavivirga abyssicola TaxID=3063533 RepID=UPI0026E07571|nr:gliding motility-associated C-terminal domain-containing protein [Flavivirga sp. MEBiC07777]WVK12824.1 gliding motility-associated C-terminal domain-containing protein [Flavivirga sp. MEBiC07777]
MKIFTKHINYHKVILIVLLLISAFAQAQLKKAFTPRFNEAVNGDFTIIANNMISTTATGNYNGGNDNDQFSNLVYVDIDTDDTTFNSSSANFVNPAPTASCLTIKKVLLYWAAADQEPNELDPNSENQPDWNYNDIKLMLPSETAYTTYTADEVIYRGREDHIGPPHNGHFSNDPYICVKDITSSVVNLIDNNISPYGSYLVANVEGKIGSLNDHNNNLPTGVSGGWQIVFVYESPLLPLKNISIFDGYGHVVNGQGSYNIDFNGFQTVPTGDVNANILIGGLEGDLGLDGDRLQIENTSNTFVDLSTSPTSPIRDTNNFFNSKITIDNANFTNRTPASTNTLGFDAAIFQLSNPSNTIIANNQTSATFRLASNKETYGLFLLGLSVDVWSPNLGPIHLTLDTPTTSLNPGASFGASFTVENKGNDDAKSLEISTTLPPQVTLVEPISPALPTGITYNYNTGTNLLEFFVADGVADAGAAAVNVDFDLEIRDECYFLETSCDLQFNLQLEASYTGTQDPSPQSVVSSANLDDCGVGILDPIVIDVIQPTISWQTPINGLDATIECSDATGLTTAQALEPVTNKCNLTLTKTPGAFVPNPTCPSSGTYTNTWNFTDACGVTIGDYIQTITVNDTTDPTVSGTILESTVEGCTAADATAPVNTVAALEALGLTIEDNCTSDANLTVTNLDTASGSCPIVVTRTYTIADACGNSTTASQTINVNDTTVPTASNPVTITVPGGPIPAPDVTVVTDEADNCTASPTVAFVSDVSDNGDCPETITRTYSVTDDCGNTINVTQTILITDPILPTASNPAGIDVQCIGDVPVPDVTVVTDEADNQGTPVVAFVSDVSDGNSCPEVITRTYSVTDICNNTINVTQTITVNDTTDPTVSGTILESTVEGCSAADATAPVNTVAALEALGLTIEDNCTSDANLTVTNLDTASGSCPIVVTRTYTIADACGNSTTASQTINVNDTTVPTASNPVTITVPGGPIPAPDVTVVTDEADNCTASPTVAFVSDVSDNGDCPETITRTYSVTDDCGNTINVTQTILITDPILPTASNPAGIDVQCIGDVPVPDVTVVTDEADNQGTPVVAFVSDVSDGNSCPEVITRTYSVTDICNNTINVTQTITVNDVTDPTVAGTILESTVEGCTAADATAPVNTVAALEALGLTIGDNCTSDANLTVTNLDTASGSCPIVVTRTYTIADACGNSTTASQIINVNDTTVPTASNPVTITVPGGPVPAPDVTVVTDEADNCTASPIVAFVSDVSDNGNCPETITRTYSVTDDCGNTISVTQTILITDPIPPTASNPAGIDVQCIDDVPVPDVTVVTDEADNQGTPVVAFVSDVSDGNSCPEVITRTYSVTDICNNTINVTQTITVNDVTDPTVAGTILESTVEGCSAADATAPVSTVAALEALGLTIEDNCTSDANLTVTNLDTASGSCPIVVTRTYTIADACGNSTTASQTINVNDTTVPTASNPVTITVPGGPIPAPDVTVVTDEADNCTANPIVAFVSDVSDNGDCPETITRTYSVTDDCGNTINVTQTILITDPIPPTASNPAGIDVQCIGDVPAPDVTVVTDEADNQGTPVVAFVSDVSDGNSCPEVITRTYSVTDICNNTINVTQTITVNDTTDPTVSGTILESTVEGCSAADATAPVSTVAALEALGLTIGDNCTSDADLTVTNLDTASGSCPIVVTRTYTIADACGNSTTASQTINVNDTTVPTASNPADINVECLADVPAPDVTVVTDEADNCTASPTVAFVSDVSDNNTCAERITRTYSVTDDCGNTINVTQTIIINDTTPPVLTLPASQTAECSDDLSPIAFGSATAIDNCDANPTITFNDVRTDGLCPGSYTITRTWKAEDACGNEITADQVISTSDTTAPEFVQTTLPGNIAVECSSDVPLPEDLDATDNCGTASVNVVDERIDGNCANNYTIRRSYIATDECGLTKSHIQTIIVEDKTPPVFEQTTLPLPSITVECDAIPNAEELTATDNCGDASVNVVDATTPGDCPNNYTITRTWTATDECGLTTTHIQVITVQDTKAPEPTSTFEETLNVSCTDIPDVPELTFTDNCSSNITVAFNETNSYEENVFADYEIVRTWIVRDECNNEETYTQTLLVALDEVVTDLSAPDWCYDEGAINMNNLLPSDLNTNGTWELLEGDPAATLNGSIFDPSNLELSADFLPESGGIDYRFRYTTTDNGCISITEVIMNVHADCVVLPCGENDITISKAVTPNGDDRNDFFYISGIELCGFTAEVKIFNRWGALVFESNAYPLIKGVDRYNKPPSGSWEGTAHKSSVGNAGKVPNGTYYYIITLKDSGLNPITGPVYLGTK